MGFLSLSSQFQTQNLVSGKLYAFFCGQLYVFLSLACIKQVSLNAGHPFVIGSEISLIIRELPIRFILYKRSCIDPYAGQWWFMFDSDL